MPKPPIEKMLDKQMKEQKANAKKQRDLQVKTSRDEKRRETAITMVQNQPIVSGLRILDDSAEIVLRSLLNKQLSEDDARVNYSYTDFPRHLQNSFGLEMEKLVLYGMITNPVTWMRGGSLSLCPSALSYFSDKEQAYAKEEMEKERWLKTSMRDISNSVVFIGNNITGSNISINNSYQRIEKEINEKGGEDKEELLSILSDVKELISSIEAGRSIPKEASLFNRISGHLAKHGWFYSEVIALLGMKAFQLLG